MIKTGPTSMGPTDMRVSTRQLQAFLLVAEVRSFTRAAETLHVTQAGLSSMINELETQVGTGCSSVRTARPPSPRPARSSCPMPARPSKASTRARWSCPR